MLDPELTVPLFKRAAEAVEVAMKRGRLPGVVGEDGNPRAPALAAQHRDLAQHLAARQPVEQARHIGLAPLDRPPQRTAQEGPQPRPARQRQSGRQTQ